MPNLITNGGFGTGSLSPWTLSVSSGTATAALDSTTAADGTTSAHVHVTLAASSNWQIDFASARFPLVSGKQYTVSFWAKSDVSQTIQVATQGGSPNWSYYGMNTMFSVGTTWARDSLTFTSTATASDTALEFFLGAKASNIWLDDVQVFATGNWK
jgi:Carbohydrate binding domain